MSNSNEAGRPLTANELFRVIHGKPEDVAREICQHHGYEVRVVKMNGRQFAKTLDYRHDRINLTINGGCVDGVDIG